MEELLNFATNLGFPMVVSFYLLIRLEGKLEGLSLAITELCQIIESRV